MKRLVLPALFLAAGSALAGPVDDLLDRYRAAGAGPFAADAGARLWRAPHPADAGDVRRCSDCHGTDLAVPGRHLRTGKTIAPLAPSAEPTRLADPAKVEKWLGRNCRWTVGRDCTAQERGDLLTWLKAL